MEKPVPNNVTKWKRASWLSLQQLGGNLEVAYCFRRRKQLFERKGIRRLSVGAQVGQALLCLLDIGDVAGGNPPESQVWTFEALKPVATLLTWQCRLL